ncbi:MAG: CpaF/VirB11 family protein, partial [Clostridiales Family XIII bacterium]|nr:CpaF/VirB11 family protein [Clostridiales Family XIII bacterium]
MKDRFVSGGEAFEAILPKVQDYLSARFADLLRADVEDRQARICAHIERYLTGEKLPIEENELPSMVRRLYLEVAEYSFLTDYLNDAEVEEIDINRWDDVKVTYADGKTRPADESFASPHHALDVVKRLLHASRMSIDQGKPLVRGHLSNMVRITALCEPVVDRDAGVCCSIRIVNPKKLARDEFIANGTASAEMLDFLSDVLMSGVSICLAGATTSGKTTLMSYLLSRIPAGKRIVTIENEVREFDLVKRDKNGKVLNNAIHLVTRNYDKKEDSIDQDKLLEYSLTLNPDVIVVGEAKSGEAMAAQEAARTGHAVLTTVHASGCAAIYYRLVTLCLQKAKGLDERAIYGLVTDAFPVTVYLERDPDTGERKVTEIAECEVLPDGGRGMRSLWQGDLDARRACTFKRRDGI